MQQPPYVNLTSAEYLRDVQSARADPFNKYDLEYACDSIRSGFDSFFSPSQTYRILDGTTSSKIDWGMTATRQSFETHFISMSSKFGTNGGNAAAASALAIQSDGKIVAVGYDNAPTFGNPNNGFTLARYLAQ